MILFLKLKYICSKWFSYYLIKVKIDFNFLREKWEKVNKKFFNVYNFY